MISTLHDLATENLDELETRYNALAVKRGIAPERLSAEEALEAIALGEAIAFHFRHPALIHWAVKSGASWQAIAEARGVDEAEARRAYGAWAHAQHQTAGLDTAAYRAALAAIKTDTLERSAELVDRINGAGPAGHGYFLQPGQVSPDQPAPDRCMTCGRPRGEHPTARPQIREDDSIGRQDDIGPIAVTEPENVGHVWGPDDV